MAINFPKQKTGLNLVPQNTTLPSVLGDIRYNSATNKLELFTGTVDPLVSEASTATLTNKTISASNNTISGLTNSNLNGSAGITNANLAAMPSNTIKGNATGASAIPVDLSPAQVASMIGAVADVGALDSQTANASGLAISGSTISTQSASATRPGMVNTTTQTFAGDKTFSSSVSTPVLFASTYAASPWFVLSNPIPGNNINIRGPSSPSGTYDIRLPATQGTSGQVLANDGSGNLYWAVPTGITLRTPTMQIFTSGSGTYTPPSSPATPLYIHVWMVGGGGGGSSGGNNSSGGNGGSTTFGSYTVGGGLGGNGLGNNGGTAASVPSTVGYSFPGSSGMPSVVPSTNTLTTLGGFAGTSGGNSIFGGAGVGGFGTTNNTFTPSGGRAAAANTGSGGGGGGIAGNLANRSPGGGGGAGGFAFLRLPATTYSYTVGTGGSGGTFSGDSSGGNGAAGIIIVQEFYQ